MSGYKTEGDQGLCLLPDAAGIFEVSLCLDPFRPEVTAGALIFLILDVLYSQREKLFR